MIVHSPAAIGLVVRTDPYRQRAARTQLDVALVAAALGQPLRIYFVGQAALQLLAGRDPAAARLPAGYRGWGSLPEMTSVHAFMENDWHEFLLRNGLEPVLEATPVSRQQMRADWSACRKVLVL